VARVNSIFKFQSWQRHRVGWIVAILVTLTVMVWLLPARLPRHEGKTVYDWMFANKSSGLQKNPGLMAIGTNAVPYLARALAMRNTPYDRYSWVRRPFTQRIAKSLGLDMRWTMPSRNIRYWATYSLVAFSFEASPALPELYAELINPDAADPQGIYECISNTGMPPESIPYLVKAWSLQTSSHLRSELLFHLARGGTNAAALAMPLAIEALDIPIQDIQRAAADALNRWAMPAPEAVPKLITLISSTNISLAVGSAAALSRITNRANAVLPALRELVQLSTNRHHEAVLTAALWRLGEPAESTRKHLESLLVTKEGRRHAAKFLGEMGQKATASIPILLRMSGQNLGDSLDIWSRVLCAMGVLKIQAHSPEAISVVEEALAYPQNAWVRATVAEDCGKLGHPALPIIPALRRALKDPDRGVRHEASQALAALEKLSPEN
jgi:hypothetical protein